MKNQFFPIQRLLAAGVIVLLAGRGPAQAQPNSGGPHPGAAPIDTPLDGGASFLVAAGLGLGLKRLRQRRRTATSPPK